MATVHPSRLGLVPGGSSRPSAPAPASTNGNGEGSSSREEELRRKLMDRRKNGDERGSGERDRKDRDGDERRDRDREDRRDRDRDERRDRSRNRDDRRDRDRRDRDRDEDKDRVRGRDGEGFRSYDSRRDERDRRRRSPEKERDDRPRRASPTYKPYDPNAPPPPNHGGGEGYGYGRRNDLPSGPPHPGGGGPGMPPPWVPRMQDAQRPNWQNPPAHQRFGNMDFERRRQERENNPLSIWPDSPKRPYQDEEELEAERKKNKSKSKSSKHKSKSKSSKHKSSKHRSSRKYSDESSSETDSEEEERRRRRRKEKERERRKRYDSDSASESEDRRRKRRRSKARDEDADEPQEDLADQWVEKGGEVVLVPSERDRHKIESHAQKSPEKVVQRIEEDSDEEIGPQLPMEGRDKGMDRSAFAHMRPGEGEAMAAYAESGQRIPRRGEIGMEADQIEKFEQSGYVMSGSRHQRMNAVRMRKENQVINEAEKRAILKLQKEEKEKKEGMIITQFKEMMEENLRKQGINRP